MEIEYRKIIEGRITAKYRVVAERAAQIDKVLAEAGQPSTVHGNARPVMIWGEINHEEHAKRIRDHGAQPITERVFPSAMSAARHFGYLWDAVGQALGRARMRGKDIAEVAGVPVRWADRVPGID